MSARRLQAVIAAEFRMQARRPTVWLAGAGGVAATLALSGTVPIVVPGQPWLAAAEWVLRLQTICPAVLGVLLADRVGRERRLRVADLLDGVDLPPGLALVGKFVGAGAATALPQAVALALGAIFLAVFQGPAAVPALALAILAIALPGLCFVAAFSLACPLVMAVPLYQFLFVGYWFWGNFLPPERGIPTLSRTILTPVGRVAAQAFFHGGGPSPVTSGIASVAVLLLGAAVALVAAARLRAARVG